jgi:hypothetical protein
MRYFTCIFDKGQSGMTKPHRVSIPVEGNDGKTRFREAGVAWPAREGSKALYRIELFAHSLSGEYVIFPPDEKDDTGDA